ncbi:MAG: hypothetical protein AB1657_02295 [Candidatus Micrarchaeota archaeon]
MAEARALERERHSRRARRRRAPLEDYPAKSLAGLAGELMVSAMRLRGTDAQAAARTAERAFGFYLAASQKASSGRERADCLVGAGKALSLAASVCEGIDARRAGRMHEDAGDHLFKGARGGTVPEAEVRELARQQYELALGMGGVPRIVERKIAMCGRGHG